MDTLQKVLGDIGGVFAIGYVVALIVELVLDHSKEPD